MILPDRESSGQRRTSHHLPQRDQERGVRRWTDGQSHLFQRRHQRDHRPTSGEVCRCCRGHERHHQTGFTQLCSVLRSTSTLRFRPHTSPTQMAWRSCTSPTTRQVDENSPDCKRKHYLEQKDYFSIATSGLINKKVTRLLETCLT